MRVPVPALLSMLVLSGCALPPIVTVASLAANGVSYATTGKGTADHALSAFAGEDCAVLRAAKDEAVCDPDGEVLIKLDGAATEDQNWYVDPETGSSVAIAAPQRETPADRLAALDPAPRATDVAAPASDRNRGKALNALIDRAAEPPARGLFADARPAPKPEAPLVQEAHAARPVTRPATAAPHADSATTRGAPSGWFDRLAEKARSAWKRPVGAAGPAAP